MKAQEDNKPQIVIKDEWEIGLQKLYKKCQITQEKAQKLDLNMEELKSQTLEERKQYILRKKQEYLITLKKNIVLHQELESEESTEIVETLKEVLDFMNFDESCKFF